jgi:hypothetical protein
MVRRRQHFDRRAAFLSANKKRQFGENLPFADPVAFKRDIRPMRGYLAGVLPRRIACPASDLPERTRSGLRDSLQTACDLVEPAGTHP